MLRKWKKVIFAGQDVVAVELRMKVILALDQGTTSSRAILFDQAGEIVATEQREFRQIFPQTGWVEHDPEEIWNTTQDVAHAALLKAKLKGTDVAAIGITNQRETTVLWDRKTGKPLHNAIVWQDRRTANCCEELKRRGLADQVQKTSGLVIDAYFSATKLRWLLENIPGARDRAQRGELAFGTIDTWLLWKLTGGRVHATDVSNASRTMLMNLATGQWDDALLKIFDIPRELLPTIRPSSGLFGESVSGILGAAVPIAGIAGDQQAALFGQACFKEGLAKNTYGTGCFMLMNVGDKPKVSTHKLLSTVAWSLPTQHSAQRTPPPTPSKAPSSSAALSSSGSATASASSNPPPKSNPSPPKSPTPAASISSPLSPGSAPPIGTSSLAAPSPASPAAPLPRTSPAPRSTA